jgi:hypothetical protein
LKNLSLEPLKQAMPHVWHGNQEEIEGRNEDTGATEETV